MSNISYNLVRHDEPVTTTYKCGYDTIRDSLPETFSFMLSLALATVTHHVSDVYHDALWLDRHVMGESFTWYFAVRECGTSIGTDHSLVGHAAHDMMWEFTLTLDDRHRCTLTVQRVTVEAEGRS